MLTILYWEINGSKGRLPEYNIQQSGLEKDQNDILNDETMKEIMANGERIQMGNDFIYLCSIVSEQDRVLKEINASITKAVFL